MNYAKLKKGLKSLNSRGYHFTKGVWLEIQEEDVEYFINCGRVEFPPAGVIPKDDTSEDNPNGVIVLKGNGKEKIVGTRETKNKIEDEFSDDERKEILNIQEKYRKKREKKEEDLVKEKKKNEKTEKQILEDIKKKEKEELGGFADITNRKFIDKKHKVIGDL